LIIASSTMWHFVSAHGYLWRPRFMRANVPCVISPHHISVLLTALPCRAAPHQPLCQHHVGLYSSLASRPRLCDFCSRTWNRFNKNLLSRSKCGDMCKLTDCSVILSVTEIPTTLLPLHFECLSCLFCGRATTYVSPRSLKTASLHISCVTE